MTEWPGTRTSVIITARQLKSRGGPSRPPYTSTTTRAAAAPEKARPQRTTVDATVGIKWPSPLPSKDNHRVARARGSKSLTLEGCSYQPEASKPAWREREPQTPSIYKDY
jgi:hypothetical protein